MNFLFNRMRHFRGIRFGSSLSKICLKTLDFNNSSFNRYIFKIGRYCSIKQNNYFKQWEFNVIYYDKQKFE